MANGFSVKRVGVNDAGPTNPEQFGYPTWTHPQICQHIADWEDIRAVMAGEPEMKRLGQKYLPKNASMNTTEYREYLAGATFYPFTGRTVSAMKGTLLKRKPIVDAGDEDTEQYLNTITKDAKPLLSAIESSVEETLTLGLYGILLDLPDRNTTKPNPFTVGYDAEHILDWDWVVNDDGRRVLSRVVLRELVVATTNSPDQTREYIANYRELRLDDGVYNQVMYTNGDEDADLVPEHAGPPIIPRRKGKTLDFIPFYAFGVDSVAGLNKVKRSPILDITRLNISHYRSYAHLEQGRFFTGFPIYHIEKAQGADEATTSYEIGAQRVWEHPAGAKPGILEFNGQGLKFLENALDQKEQQAASLGGRMIGIRTSAVSESDNAVKMKDRNENAILLDIANSMDIGWTTIIQWAIWWRGFDDASEAGVTFNKDFLFDNIGAREFRAVHSMYSDGVLPVEVIYEYFRKSDIIPDWMTQKEFLKLLKNPKSFPLQPDAMARKEGFPDRKTQLDDEQANEDRKVAEKNAAKAAKVAEITAKNPAPTAPGAPVEKKEE